ncbi:hypothetical protein GAYE_SCF02G2084 [Galdieria yellowstonensis]|uniref:RRM domain-containing protein n=1 Tax=Galdieria yellowstonensis TaxID=3028027 RepID=A0AAV9I9T2_9RHOD|nr:hypothetical protein GAYE_SCF02G2084 [Galdieria yellowstonensis]
MKCPCAGFLDALSFVQKKSRPTVTRRQTAFRVGFHNLLRVYPWRNNVFGVREKKVGFLRMKADETFIQCPECGTIYSVQVEEIESQRAVRCGDCLHEWLATEEELLEIDPMYLGTLLEEEQQEKESRPLENEKNFKLFNSIQDSDKTETLCSERVTRNSLEAHKKEGEKVLFVGNLSYKASEKDLFKVFSSCGQVLDVRIPRSNSKAHRGFAFIRMNVTGASIALQRLQGASVVGRPIVVSESVTHEKTVAQGDEEESNQDGNSVSLDDDVLDEEDWDTDFGPDEQLLGQEAYSNNGLRFYLRGSNSRKSPNGKV